VSPGFSQDQAQLEANRVRLQKQIFDTQELLRKTKSDHKNSLVGYQAMQAQVDSREKLVDALNAEVKSLDRTLHIQEGLKEEMETRIQSLKGNYENTLRNAYLINRTQHPLMYILSAENLNQGFRRWAYLRQLDRFQKLQLRSFHNAQDSLQQIVLQIQQKKEAKSELIIAQSEQKKEIEKELEALEKVLDLLKTKEKSLKSELAKKKSENAKLTREIERLILAETNKSKSSGNLPNAPALEALSNEFTTNKGKLPWPVRKGMITGKFGEQPHPVLRSIKINNNGVDISSELAAPVQSIFEGTVVGMKNIPGFDNMVIVQHGSFYSVYSKLGDVFVQKGDKISTGQSIGRLSVLNANGLSTLHFEIWNGKKQMNPEHWLAR